jgi:hypothetical protein
MTFWIGAAATTAWLLLALYVAFFAQTRIWEFKSDEIGTFLSGWLAPVGFLWLVLGFIQQGFELRQNAAALRLQASELKQSVEQLSIQARTMSESEKNQRLDVALHLYEVALNRLAVLSAGLLYHLSDVYRVGDDDRERARLQISQRLENLWSRYANGDKDIFFGVLRRDLEHAGYQDVNDMTDKVEVRRQLESIMRNFLATRDDAEDRLRERDAANFMILHLTEGSPFRTAHRLKKILYPAPPFE